MARADRIDLLASTGLADSAPNESSVTSCLHCGLDVPRSRLARGNQFCCSGCDHVYKLIHDSNLERYYELRPERGVPVSGFREDAFGWLEPLLAAERSGDGLLRLALDIQGVHCAACVWLLQQLYERYPGAVQLRINPGRGSADVVWDPAAGDVREYLAGAMRFGYRFGLADGASAREVQRHPHPARNLAAAAMNVMIFSLCYYFGLSSSDGWIYTVLGQVSILLTAVAAFVGAKSSSVPPERSEEGSSTSTFRSRSGSCSRSPDPWPRTSSGDPRTPTSTPSPCSSPSCWSGVGSRSA
ncbi:MAG: heavy metal translocating P-type ATPase metal-binding domain-containing protein [Candidatus Eisenbacteria bacterium]